MHKVDVYDTNFYRKSLKESKVFNKDGPIAISPLDLDVEVPPDQSLEVMANPSVPGTTITKSGHVSKPPDQLVADCIRRDIVVVAS